MDQSDPLSSPYPVLTLMVSLVSFSHSAPLKGKPLSLGIGIEFLELTDPHAFTRLKRKPKMGEEGTLSLLLLEMQSVGTALLDWKGKKCLSRWGWQTRGHGDLPAEVPIRRRSDGSRPKELVSGRLAWSPPRL